jgi:hypothetical protein
MNLIGNMQMRRVVTSSRDFGLLLAFALWQCSGLAAAQKTPTAKGEAPADQAIVGSKLGGSYFAPKPLKEKYDQLLSRVRSVEVEINEGTISGDQAKREIEQLRVELAEVRKQIEEQKTFVPAGKVHTKSDTTTFKLGVEQRLLILASKVRIIGWDKPEVKCVLDKAVLTAGDKDVDNDLAQMQLVHEHRSAENEVGKTAEELEAEEAEYLASAEGQKLEAKQIQGRRKFLEQRKAWQQIYRPIQGREIDVIAVKGLTHDEGNRQITLDLSSPGGERSMSSHWQRHATLTVYVPTCQVVALQGGLGGLEIETVDANVIVRGDGDRDYNGQFRVKGVKGSLVVDRLPLDTIDRVVGDVDVTMTAYLGNSGTRHVGDTRTSYVFAPLQYTYRNIGGNLRAWMVRADLELANIGGTIDVVNEYGTTRLTVTDTLPSAAHRVVSDGGRIEVKLSEGALGELPVLAVSESGTVRMSYRDRAFEDVSWTASAPTNELRGWHGFERKAPAAGNDSFFDRFERVSNVLDNESRTAGLDLISRGGLIEISRLK